MSDDRPRASSDAVRKRMSSQGTRDTDPEVKLRSALHQRGLRYRIHRQPVADLRIEADIVFGPVNVAVYVDGCFWHGCPEHASWPEANADWWRNKIERNRARDRETDAQLEARGWKAIRVWEHEDPDEAADRVEEIVRQLRGDS